MYFFSLHVDGPRTGGAYKRGGGAYKRQFTVCKTGERPLVKNKSN